MAVKSCPRKQWVPAAPLAATGEEAPRSSVPCLLLHHVWVMWVESLGWPPPCQPCALWVLRVGGVKLQVHWTGDPGWLHSPAWCPGEGSWVLPPQVVSLQRPRQEAVSLTCLRTLGEQSPSVQSAERLGHTSPAQVRKRVPAHLSAGGCPLPVSLPRAPPGLSLG